jgi:hypothetical protein
MARYIAPKIATYVDDGGAPGDLAVGPAPAARTEFLTALNAATLDLLTTPYAVPILCHDFGDGVATSNPDYHAAPMVVAPATRAFVPFFARSIGIPSTGTPLPSGSFTFDEADPFNAAFVVPVDPPFAEGADVFPMTSLVAGVYGASEEVTTPVAATDRAHILIAGFQAHLVRVLVTSCQGFSGVPFQVANLDTI